MKALVVAFTPTWIIQDNFPISKFLITSAKPPLAPRPSSPSRRRWTGARVCTVMYELSYYNSALTSAQPSDARRSRSCLPSLPLLGDLLERPNSTGSESKEHVPTGKSVRGTNLLGTTRSLDQ